jgi:GDP/UDP-N,N'-diacetylbacillosamine 2-epimerase (hydrolysing)
VTRKVCVVTGSRAEYGLLRWVIEEIRDAPDLELQIVATGAHLSPEHGLTFREIEADGFRVDRMVEMLLRSDTPVGIAKSMGLGLIGFADALQELQPDLLLVLGDRYEILSAVEAALIAGVPVAHLHGGESSEGAFDEAIRHSVTKMSHLHFVAAAEYRDRVVQLGEHPDRVFLVGGLGVDGMKRLELLDRKALEESLGIQFAQHNLLVTYHPVTLDASSLHQMEELLAALALLDDTLLIFTMPNADTEGRALWSKVEDFVGKQPRAHAFTSLGHRRYLSCIAQVDGVVGNSSSGLTEVPSFRKGTVNIGDRQRGRLRAASVIDCDADRAAIGAAIHRLYSRDFQESLETVCNPYGEGGASQRVVEILRRHPLGELLKKSFYDLAPKMSVKCSR